MRVIADINISTAVVGDDLKAGCIITVDDSSIRLHRLPIGSTH